MDDLSVQSTSEFCESHEADTPIAWNRKLPLDFADLIRDREDRRVDREYHTDLF